MFKKIRHLKRRCSGQKRENLKLSNEKFQQLETFFFPKNSLQERQENFSLFYARQGNDPSSKLYDASLTLEQQFAILEAE